MEKKLTLVEKLASIKSIADAVEKDKRGFNYKYADITSILAKVNAGMKKYGVSLIPMVTPGTTKIEKLDLVNTKVDKTGKAYDSKSVEMLVSADMIFRWVNNEDKEDFIDVPWVVVGSQGDPSQAFGSALTYCTRYFMCNYFQIALPDTDVDTYRTKQKEAEEAEGKSIAKGIIEEFDTTVKMYLADHAEKKDEVVKFVGKYVKGANYNNITNPLIASKLKEDFAANFLNN